MSAPSGNRSVRKLPPIATAREDSPTARNRSLAWSATAGRSKSTQRSLGVCAAISAMKERHRRRRYRAGNGVRGTNRRRQHLLRNHRLRCRHQRGVRCDRLMRKIGRPSDFRRKASKPRADLLRRRRAAARRDLSGRHKASHDALSSRRRRDYPSGPRREDRDRNGCHSGAAAVAAKPQRRAGSTVASEGSGSRDDNSAALSGPPVS